MALHASISSSAHVGGLGIETGLLSRATISAAMRGIMQNLICGPEYPGSGFVVYSTISIRRNFEGTQASKEK